MEETRKARGFFRANKIRAYLLIKSIKGLLKDQEKRIRRIAKRK